ncbi:Ubiquitin carboxyl-terminal hydrolase, partial [Pseudoloma neurophilia]
MTFKWNTKLPNLSHKIKSEDFEVSNRIYRIVVACVTHIVPQMYLSNENTQSDEKLSKINEVVHFVCLCGKGCSKNTSTSRLYFIGIEYRGNSYTPIPTNINMKIEGDKTKRLSMVFSFSKYEDYYGEYFEIPCIQYSKNDNIPYDQLKMTISLIIQPYKQYLIGIRNLGATCYINSLIQTFFWNEEFFKKIMKIDCFSNNKILMKKDDNLLKKEEKIMYRNIKSLQSIFYLLTPAISQIKKLTDDLLENGSGSNIDSYTAGDTSNCQEVDKLPYPTTFNPVSHLQFSLLGPIHEHQDVHEWFKMLMDRIEGEMKEYCHHNTRTITEKKDTPESLDSSPKDETALKNDKIIEKCSENSMTKDFFNEIFDGKMSHIIQSDCGCVSRREQIFSEIEIDFFDCTYDCPYNSFILNQFNNQQARFINNLQHSLEHHFSKEELIKPNQYFCEKHQAHFNATKYIKIKRMPSNLVFIIKRFNMNWETMGVEKCDREMRFTEYVD